MEEVVRCGGLLGYLRACYCEVYTFLRWENEQMLSVFTGI